MAYDDGYHSADDDDLESTEESIRSMPLYDEDGIEIPDDELPWNNVSEEEIPDDASIDWMLDDSEGSEESNQSARLGVDFPFADNRSASERRKRIAQSVREEALRRLELSARTTSEFQTLVHWYDREEQSRMRRERRYENLRGNTPMEYDALSEGDIFPSNMSQPTFRQICRGEFDDYLANCLFEMHDLTDRAHIRQIVKHLKLDHKEIVYFLGVRLYSTQKLADLRGQSERNIRKVRDTVRRRIHRKLYEALMELSESGGELLHMEQDFLRTYTPTKRRASSDDESV